MKEIHKFTIPVQDESTVMIPHSWKFLTIQIQNGDITMWCEVNDQNKRNSYTFKIFGTGHEIDTIAGYLGTVQLNGYVWHVYC